MQILILMGTRNHEGRTVRTTDAIIRGITKGGGSTERIFLPELAIERCRQCEINGWGVCRSEGRCIIEDDFPVVVNKIRASDAVVFATPVYFGDLSESMRAFLDRLRRIGFRRQEAQRNQGIPTVGLCLAGGGGGGAVSCCLSLERVLLTCGFDVVDMIPVRRQNLEAKLPVLELTGEWLTTKPTSQN